MDESEKAHIGDRAREARKARRMTQQDVADEAGVSLGTISGLERGETIPQRTNRAAIARALGADVFGEASADELRYSWPNDVQVFADTLGQYLAALDPQTRAATVAKWMQDIISQSE